MGATSLLAGISRHVRSRSKDEDNNIANSSPNNPQSDSGGGLRNTGSDIPAWRVHTNRPSSAGLMDNNPPVDHEAGPDVQAPTAATLASSIPSRSSSLRSNATDHAHRRRKSLPRPELDRIDSETIPGLRPADMAIPAALTTSHTGSEEREANSIEENLTHQVRRLSLNKPLPQAPEVEQRGHSLHKSSVPQDTNRDAVLANDHLRLPDGFELRDSSHTVVDTNIMPTVTHEKVHRKITEVQQEVVTRDVHFHHYYNYIQPIRVVEILPARHYILNTRGEKIEIPPPPGWQMPSSLTPYTPDLSGIRGSVRHYLVDEEHPMGIDEPAPPGFSRDITPQIVRKQVPS